MKSMHQFVVRAAFSVLALAAGLGGACGGDKPPVVSPEPAQKAGAGSAPSAPSKEEIAKLDCEKACAVQRECFEKSGLKNQSDETQSACAKGCKMAVGVYDPARHGTIMAKFVRYAAGECR